MTKTEIKKLESLSVNQSRAVNELLWHVEATWAKNRGATKASWKQAKEIVKMLGIQNKSWADEFNPYFKEEDLV